VTPPYAVVAFQRLHRELTEDGIIGPLTWSKLITEAANKDTPARVIQAAVISLIGTSDGRRACGRDWPKRS
jgi:hypothetical protein